MSRKLMVSTMVPILIVEDLGEGMVRNVANVIIPQGNPLKSPEGEEAAALALNMAAAPDLLEATENFLGLFDNPIYRRKLAGDSLYEEAIKQARAAREKAKGTS